MALAYFVEIFLFFFYGGPRFFLTLGGEIKMGIFFFTIQRRRNGCLVFARVRFGWIRVIG